MPIRPGDIPLHTCGGVARVWASPEVMGDAYCMSCRAPIAAEQPWLPGHAGVFCSHCLTAVGFCGGGLLAAVLADAEMAVRG